MRGEIVRDALLFGGWVLSAAALLTAHVFILFRAWAHPRIDGWSKGRTRWLVLLSLALPPLVPWLALRSGQRASAVVWLVFAAIYVGLWLVSLAV